MKKITPAILTDNDIKQLDQLLLTHAVPNDGMDLEMLDGFVSALVVSPVLIMPSQWQPMVWGTRAPQWETMDEAMDAQRLLMGLWHTAVKRASWMEDELPHELMPLVATPEDADEKTLKTYPLAALWAAGFLEGIKTCESQWFEWIEREKWIMDFVADLLALAHGKKLSAVKRSTRQLTFKQRLQMLMDIPVFLWDLDGYRKENYQPPAPQQPVRAEAKPGRNELCPCGSGKKYKKCCALQTRH